MVLIVKPVSIFLILVSVCMTVETKVYFNKHNISNKTSKIIQDYDVFSRITICVVNFSNVYICVNVFEKHVDGLCC